LYILTRQVLYVLILVRRTFLSRGVLFIFYPDYLKEDNSRKT